MEATKYTNKQVKESIKQVAKSAMSLNQCLKSFNGVLTDENGKKTTSIWKMQLENGATIEEMFNYMGVELEKGKFTVKVLRGFWAEVRINNNLAIYKNVPIYTKDNQRVYVEKDGKMNGLTEYMIREIGQNDWTPALICKGIQQNWLPLHEAKKSKNSIEKAQAHEKYYILEDKAFVEVAKEEIEF